MAIPNQFGDNDAQMIDPKKGGNGLVGWCIARVRRGKTPVMTLVAAMMPWLR